MKVKFNILKMSSKKLKRKMKVNKVQEMLIKHGKSREWFAEEVNKKFNIKKKIVDDIIDGKIFLTINYKIVFAFILKGRIKDFN